MSHVEGFPPIYSRQSKVLILGSMPGQVSLQKQQYYAHSRNAFWQIMSDLFSFPLDENYEARVESLIANKVAVWDVMQQCVRAGSLDSSIDDQTVITNDFSRLFSDCPNLTAVFFNGRKAQQTYVKYVLSELTINKSEFSKHLLPSTSPAYAAMPYTEKYQIWRMILDYL